VSEANGGEANGGEANGGEANGGEANGGEANLVCAEIVYNLFFIWVIKSNPNPNGKYKPCGSSRRKRGIR